MRFSQLLFAVASATEPSAIFISPPHTVPQNASRPINPSFPGFAFEEASFYYYAGNKSHPNHASNSLIQAIAQKTQTKPMIRVGGTSLDHSTYHPEQKKAIIIPPKEKKSGIPMNMKLGPAFFDSFHNFPNAQYMVDIPWAKNYFGNSALFAKAAYNSIGKDNIYALELGNEPNVYSRNRGAPKEEHMKEYAKDWARWTTNLSAALDVGRDDPLWQAVVLSSETGRTGFPGGTNEDWKIPELFNQGLEKYKKRMKSVSMHYYQTKENKNSDLQHDLMNHDAIVKGSDFIRAAVKTLNNETPKIPLYVAEVGNTLGNGTKNIELEGSLGSALWQVDFSLYAMHIGVAGIGIQSGIKFPFSLWIPQVNETAGEVLPAFYGLLFSAEFIGPHRNVQVENIDLGMPFLSAYAAYEDGKLARLAIVNLHLWSRSSPGDKHPSRNITLAVGTDVKSATVKRLSSPNGGSATAKTITWGGTQWVYGDDENGTQQFNGISTVPLANGKVHVSVNASEAIIVSLGH